MMLNFTFLDFQMLRKNCLAGAAAVPEEVSVAPFRFLPTGNSLALAPVVCRLTIFFNRRKSPIFSIRKNCLEEVLAIFFNRRKSVIFSILKKIEINFANNFH